jgi:hypothetical protein
VTLAVVCYKHVRFLRSTAVQSTQGFQAIVCRSRDRIHGTGV